MTAAFDQAFAELDTLLASVDRWPDDERKASARELARVLLELHRHGLAQLLRSLAPACAVVDDPAVAALLVLHDLHPTSFEERARAAVERAQRAYPDLRLVAVESGRVVVGAGARGGATSATMAIERALLEALPDAVEVVVRGDDPGLVQLRRREPSP